MAKNSLRILKRRIVARHEDGQGYKKIANTLKMSCSTVAKIIQRFKRAGSTQNRPRVVRPKKLSALAEHHIPNAFFERSAWGVLSALLQKLKRWGVSLLVLRTIRRTLHQIGMHGCHPRGKLLLKTIHKGKPPNSLQKTCQQSTRITGNYVLWSDAIKINLFGSNGFKHVWQRPGGEYKDKCVLPTVKHAGGSVMV